MKKKLIKTFTITSQLLLVSIFLTFMLASKNLASNKVVIENTNLNKSSDIVNKMFLVQPVSLEKEKKDEQEVIEELKVAPVEEKTVENVEIPIIQQPAKEEPENEPQRLSSVDISKYIANENLGFVITTDNTNYNLKDADLDFVVATVAAEMGGDSIDDALAVISVILNRCEPSSSWSSYINDGMNPIAQIKAPKQFAVYIEGYYEDYMPGGRLYGKTKYNLSKSAVIDALNGVRNNSYQSFRSYDYKINDNYYSDNYIVVGGNRYR